jgi:hypothetical protein
VIDEERLNAVHEAVEARFGFSDPSGREIDYRGITIREHGELGPVLTVKGQHFTGPEELGTTAGLTRVIEPYTASQKDAVRLFSGGSYIDVNDHLRNGAALPANLSNSSFNIVQTMDEAMERSILAEDTTLLRGLYYRPTGPNYQGIASLKAGDIFEDAAFLSTTKASQVPDSFIGNVTMVIKAKAGSRGIDLNEAIGGIKFAREQEVLLPRGSRLRVINNEKTGKNITLTVEVVDDVL